MAAVKRLPVLMVHLFLCIEPYLPVQSWLPGGHAGSIDIAPVVLRRFSAS